jgi:phosphatidylglycerophosphate synthase
MTTPRPSVTELRAVAQPDTVLGRSAHEHWSGRLYVRRLSIHLTRLLVPTPVTPDQLTALMGATGIAAALVLTVPRWWSGVLACAALQLQVLLDCSDGELARWRGPTGGARGVYLDSLAHWTTDAAVVCAVGVHADGGLSSPGGWTTLGLVAAVLALVVHAETDLVYVARMKAALPRPETDAVVPRVGVVRRLRHALSRLPVNRLLSAWDLAFVLLAMAVAEAAGTGLRGSEVLTVVLVVVGIYTVVGHLVSVLSSRRLR